MKKKIIYCLFSCFMLVFSCTVALQFINTNKSHDNSVPDEKVRTVAEENLDFASYYSALKENYEDVNISFNDNDSTFHLSATQTLTLDMFEEIENLSLGNDGKFVKITYDTVYDPEKNIVKLIAYADGEKSDELIGCPYTTNDGNVDVAFNVDGETILLSELQDSGVIQNCGWFSRMFRKVAKIAAQVVVAAAVVVAVAAVAYVAAPAIAAAVTTVVSVTTGGAAVLGSTAAVTAAITTGAAAVATTAATTAVVAAAVAAGAAVGAEIEEEYQLIESTMASVRRGVRALASTIAATVAEITLDRNYYFAYLTRVLNIDYSVAMNYLEAYAVLWFSGLINTASSLGKFTVDFLSKIVLSGPIKALIEKIKNNSAIRVGYVGIYTNTEPDAAKLAYAAGGFFRGVAESENHDTTVGSGYYYHFHDFSHTIHVWYGSPA